MNSRLSALSSEDGGDPGSDTPITVNICSLDFGPTLRLLASKVAAML